MIIGSAVIELEIAENASLKDKRRVVKSVLARLRHDYNVAAAEVDAQDQWRRAVIAIVTVSTDAGHAHGLLEKAVADLESWRLDCTLAGYQVEIW